jgi:hypothetical protein
MPEAMHSPTEAESKDLMESDRLKVVEKLHACQDKMKAHTQIIQAR